MTDNQKVIAKRVYADCKYRVDTEFKFRKILTERGWTEQEAKDMWCYVKEKL